MTERTNLISYSLSDREILVELGGFLRSIRLQQNKSQKEIAIMAGVNRSTVLQIENGSGSTMISFIQVLRALGQFHLLELFQIKPVVSPSLLAKLEVEKLKRAKRKGSSSSKMPPSDW